MLAVLLAAIRWSNAITLGSVIVGVVLGLITLASFVLLVRRKGLIDGLSQDLERARGVAEDWRGERDAAVAKADRLTQEIADEKVHHAAEMNAVLEEQRDLRHQLKDELAGARLETEVWKQKGDQTPVFEGISATQAGLKEILERLTSAERSGVSTIAQMLEGMDERAAKRDAVIVETQQQIVAHLSRIADVVVERVGEVVEEKLQATEEAP